MIERFDASIQKNNECWEKFRLQHLNRYKIASQLIKKLIPSVNTIYGKARPVLYDLACGSGYGFDLLRLVSSYYGFDIDQNTIDKLNDTYLFFTTKSYFYRLDLEKELLNFVDSQTYPPNIIISFETIEHLNNPLEFLKNCRKILDYDGLFFLSAPTSLTKDFDPYHNHDYSTS